MGVIICRVEAASVKFLKRKKAIDRKNLFELIQNDLYRFFKADPKMYDAVIDSLTQKEYCKKLQG